jgi:hypothetical protein
MDCEAAPIHWLTRCWPEYSDRPAAQSRYVGPSAGRAWVMTAIIWVDAQLSAHCTFEMVWHHKFDETQSMLSRRHRSICALTFREGGKIGFSTADTGAIRPASYRPLLWVRNTLPGAASTQLGRSTVFYRREEAPKTTVRSYFFYIRFSFVLY